jgi:hypothetical protein
LKSPPFLRARQSAKQMSKNQHVVSSG